jgi:hypothetical protein
MQATAAQKPREVFVQGWGTVYIRSLTVAEVEEQSADTANDKDKNRLARSAARLLCDEKGQRLLDPDNAEDVKLLAEQPWKLLRSILNASDDLKETNEGN